MTFSVKIVIYILHSVWHACMYNDYAKAASRCNIIYIADEQTVVFFLTWYINNIGVATTVKTISE